MDIITNACQALLGSGLLHWGTDTIYACLYSSGAAFTKDSVAYTATNELATNYGYTRKTYPLASKTVTWDDANDQIMYDCADLTWTAAGGDIGPARYCAMVHSGESKYLYIIDFGSDKTANTGTDFKVTIDVSGLMRSRQS
jgi:hypothetical protein